MCSMEKLKELKELAIKQMRAASDLYEMVAGAEEGLDETNEDYNKYFLKAQRQLREGVLKHKFGLMTTKEEKKLWDELLL